MDLTDAGAGAETYGRSAADFQNGSSGNPYRVATSMGAHSASYEDAVGRHFTPESVLNQTVGSGNGMSANDYSSRVLSNGGMLPTLNGMDAKTGEGIDRLLLDGMRTVGTL